MSLSCQPNVSIYECHTANSDTITPQLWDELCRFVDLQSQKHTDHPAVVNMGFGDAGLLANIGNRSRWSVKDGEISILRTSGLIIGVSCVEHGEIHPDVSVGGVRCWIDSEHRTTQLMSRYLLNSNLNWSRSRRKVGMLLTFNQYNKWLYTSIQRISVGRAAGIGTVWSDWWKDCVPLPRPINIRHTDQWCVIKPTGLAPMGDVVERMNQHG